MEEQTNTKKNKSKKNNDYLNTNDKEAWLYNRNHWSRNVIQSTFAHLIQY